MLLLPLLLLCALSFAWGDSRQLQQRKQRTGARIHREAVHELASISGYEAGTCPYDTRSMTPDWRVHTSRSRTDKVPLLWISSQEGLLSHFFQAEKLWRIIVLQHRRPLVIAPFVSVRHYGEFAVRLCEFFAFPRDILCLRAPRYASSVISVHPPSCRCHVLANLTLTAMPQFATFAIPEYFNVTFPSNSAGQVIESASFDEEQCLAGFVDNLNGFHEPPPFRIDKAPYYDHETVDGTPVSSGLVNITDGALASKTLTVPLFPTTAISRRYMSLVPVMRAALGVDGVGLHPKHVDWVRPFIASHTHTTTTMLVVVHWRRGDYLQGTNSRCFRKLDVSVNCATPQEFVDEVNRKVAEYGYIRRGKKFTIYVATNEVDANSLQVLRKAGFKVKQDLIDGLHAIVDAERDSAGGVSKLSDIFPLRLPLSNPDDFAIDMALVCSADEHVHFGYSNYNKFVSRCRPKRERGVGSEGGGSSQAWGQGSGKGKVRVKAKGREVQGREVA